MNEAAAVWFRGLDPAWLFALDVAAKAAVLCLSAMLLDFMLGPRRVLIRSAVWNACLAGLFLFPWAAWKCPEWSVACLVARPSDTGPAPVVVDTIAEPATLPRGDEPLEIATLDRRPNSAATAAVLYLVGIALFAVRLVRDWRAVRTWLAASRPVSDPQWSEALAHWSDRLQLAGKVQLVCCEKLSIPVVVGWRRPRVVLPEKLVESAARQRIDAVLLHELAHIARGDYAWNVAWRLVQAVYWPHPLSWLVGRRLNAVREQACDEVCIYWMSDRQAYRRTLVDLAAGIVRRPLGTLAGCRGALILLASGAAAR